MPKQATIFGVLTVGGVVMALIGLGVGDSGVRLVLIAFGSAMFGGALAYFLVRSS